MMGQKVFILEDIMKDWEDWIKFSYQPAKVPVMMDTKVGKELSEEGWQPEYPVICVPGMLYTSNAP